MRRRSRFVGRPPSPPSSRASRRSCAWRSRASRLSGVSSYSFAASLAGPRRGATPCTSTSMRTGPVRSSSLSPARTSLLGFAATPFTLTRPAFTASAASARVFTRRAAHSHLSTRMRSSAAIALQEQIRRAACLVIGPVHGLAHGLAVLELPDLAQIRNRLEPAALPDTAEVRVHDNDIGRQLLHLDRVGVAVPGVEPFAEEIADPAPARARYAEAGRFEADPLDIIGKHVLARTPVAFLPEAAVHLAELLRVRRHLRPSRSPCRYRPAPARRPSAAGAAPSCRTCRRSSSGPRR